MPAYDIIKKSKLIPYDFNWVEYISLHDDLKLAGVDSETKAKQHYLKYGRRENRRYKLEDCSDNILQKNGSSTELTHTINTNFNEFKLKRLIVSILLFYPEETSVNFLSHAPQLLIRKCIELNFNAIEIRIHNNSLNYNSKLIGEQIDKIIKTEQSETIDLKINYTESHNRGYGSGHNLNLSNVEQNDTILILNDDIGFPHVNWLTDALKYLYTEKYAIVGASQSPQYINILGDGNTRNILKLVTPEYVEGSILLTKGDVFKTLQGFDKHFTYFYFEDVDFCLRARSRGYTIQCFDIPHQHFRSKSAQKIPDVARSSIFELNRAKFLTRWGNYLQSKKRIITKRALILITADGLGDISDCFLPVKQLIANNPDTQFELCISKTKIHFLYDFFKLPIVESFEEENYDSIYSLNDLNFSPPFHTLDLISAKMGLEKFSYSCEDIKQYTTQLKYDSNSIKDNNKKNIVLHLDSQRHTFEARMPRQDVFIPLLQSLKNYTLILIGEKYNEKHVSYNSSFEVFLNDLAKTTKVIDYRNSTVKDMFKIINNAWLFIGVDSGPSHMAQLLNIPSFVIYGPINPITKIYRYANSGCWYNDKLDAEDGTGAYHLMLKPSYFYDIRRDFKCIDVCGDDLKTKVNSFIENNFKFDWLPFFDFLRRNQRTHLLLQLNNPLYDNKIITAKKNHTNNSILKVIESVEQYINDITSQ